MAAFTRGASPNMSMREKAVYKRRINKEHNSNFRAGYVHVNEEHLHKTGVRGRKKYFIYAVTGCLILVALINFLITVTIVGVLHVSKDGVETLEFIPGGELLRFLGNSYIGKAMYAKVLTGLLGRGVNITGINGQPVNISVSRVQGSSVELGSQGIKVKTREGLSVVNPKTGKVLFDTNDQTSGAALFGGLHNLKTGSVATHRITSDVKRDLNIKADQTTVTLQGNEGISAEGRHIVVKSKEEVNMRSKAIILLDGKEGVFLNQVRRFPNSFSGSTDGTASYKVCVCMPAGELFAVPAPFNCDQANEDKNPCVN